MRGHSGNKNRFIFFCVYGFGVPVILAAIVVLIDNTNFVPPIYRPSIGERTCWIRKDMKVEAIFVYLPIFLIITSNTGFFFATAYKIFCVQKETSHVRKGESGRHASTTSDTARFKISKLLGQELFTIIILFRFFLYLRLFLILGMTWVIEILSWAFADQDNSNKSLSLVLHISSILNCIQGILIFIFFVCKRSVKTMFLQR